MSSNDWSEFKPLAVTRFNEAGLALTWTQELNTSEGLLNWLSDEGLCDWVSVETEGT